MGWFAGGDPAELIPPTEWERIRRVVGALDYPGTVFGVGRSTGGSEMPDIATRYARGLALHRYDELLDVRPTAPPPAGDQRKGKAKSRAGGQGVVPLPE
jgi:gamma-carbonic anhydrase